MQCHGVVHLFAGKFDCILLDGCMWLNGWLAAKGAARVLVRLTKSFLVCSLGCVTLTAWSWKD